MERLQRAISDFEKKFEVDLSQKEVEDSEERKRVFFYDVNLVNSTLPLRTTVEFTLIKETEFTDLKIEAHIYLFFKNYDLSSVNSINSAYDLEKKKWNGFEWRPTNETS